MPVAGSAANLVEALGWTSGDAIFRKAHEDFLDAASQAFGATLRVLATDGALRQDITGPLERVSPTGLLRLVLAPEVTTRTMWPRIAHDGVDFLYNSVVAELARDGHTVATNDVIWSALGDFRIVPPNSVQYGIFRNAFVPVDVDSPFAPSLQLTGMQTRGTVVLASLNQSDRIRACEALRNSEIAIGQTSKCIHGFVRQFIKVLVLRFSRQTRFECTSLTRFVGRPVFFGSGWSELDVDDVSESLVHEAIHGFLLMEEHREAWVKSDQDMRVLLGPILSPWTGARLRLASFIHACFVWYGLVNFWRLALQCGSFVQSSAERRLNRAASGFLRKTPAECFEDDDWDSLRGDLKDALWAMHDRVVISVG